MRSATLAEAVLDQTASACTFEVREPPALTNHGAWEIALVIALVAALIVAALLVVLVRATGDIRTSAARLLEVAGNVAGNTANIPQLEATAPVLDPDEDELA